MRRYLALVLSGALALGASAAAAGGGSFTGASGHKTTGSVDVIQTAEGWEVHLKEDFTFDGAPDPRVGFGSGGSFTAETDFEPLRANSGAQVYKVPEGIDPAAFDEVYIWCRKYSVPLGVAKLSQ